MDIVKFFEVRTGYTFKDQSLPEEAILAAGASSQRNDVEGDPRGNKRLALIGDALIRLEIVDQWHATGVPPSQTQKFVSRRASNKNLERIGREAGLAKYIITHPGQKNAGRTTLASAVEALVGAAWLDSNKDFTAVRMIVRTLSIDPTSR
jgi:ribonuclease-3